ncbi:AAA family ATPase [bacterium]|nr:AAA family ATPase [bacterium]
MVKTVLTFSPKGGSGTSIITANMAIYLAQKGKKVLLMDAAPNAGTLHFYLNLPIYSVSMKQYEHFSILPLLNTDYQNLMFFSNLTGEGKRRRVADYLIKWKGELAKTDFDYIFIDMGSSVSEDLLESIAHVDATLLFTTPDPLAIEKANYFFEKLFYHRMRTVQDTYDLHYTYSLLQQNADSEMLFNPRNVLIRLAEKTPRHKEDIFNVIDDVKIGLFYNYLNSNYEGDMSDTYHLLIRNYFGFDLNMIGELPMTEVITTSVAKMIPVVTHEKGGEFQEVLRVATSRLATMLSL